MSLFPELRFKESLRFVKDMLRHHQWRSAVVFLWSLVIRDPVEALVPQWVRRNWWILLIAIAFLVAEVVLVLCIIPFRELADLAAHGELNERLGLARLNTAVVTFLLALVGACLAIFEIRRALARPRLLLSFQGLSSRLATVFVPEQPSSPDQPWRCCEVDIRVWNLSDVMARHFAVRLVFQDTGPFLVRVREGPAGAGRAWQQRRDFPGTQWEFRSEEPVKLYGQDVMVIGRILVTLPPEAVRRLEGRPPASYTMWIRAFLRDEWAGHQQTLQLTLEEARSDRPT